MYAAHLAPSQETEINREETSAPSANGKLPAGGETPRDESSRKEATVKNTVAALSMCAPVSLPVSVCLLPMQTEAVSFDLADLAAATPGSLASAKPGAATQIGAATPKFAANLAASAQSVGRDDGISPSVPSTPTTPAAVSNHAVSNQAANSKRPVLTLTNESTGSSTADSRSIPASPTTESISSPLPDSLLLSQAIPASLRSLSAQENSSGTAGQVGPGSLNRSLGEVSATITQDKNQFNKIDAGASQNAAAIPSSSPSSFSISASSSSVSSPISSSVSYFVSSSIPSSTSSAISTEPLSATAAPVETNPRSADGVSTAGTSLENAAISSANAYASLPTNPDGISAGDATLQPDASVQEASGASAVPAQTPPTMNSVPDGDSAQVDAIPWSVMPMSVMPSGLTFDFASLGSPLSEHIAGAPQTPRGMNTAARFTAPAAPSAVPETAAHGSRDSMNKIEATVTAASSNLTGSLARSSGKNLPVSLSGFTHTAPIESGTSSVAASSSITAPADKGEMQSTANSQATSSTNAATQDAVHNGDSSNSSNNQDAAKQDVDPNNSSGPKVSTSMARGDVLPAVQASASSTAPPPSVDSPIAIPASLDAAPPAASPDSGRNANAAPSPNNPAASVEPQPAPPAGPVQMAQMISKAGQSEMRVGLNTSAFGNVEVRTTVHANDVGVVIGSERGDLHSLIASDLPTIADTLQQQNLRLNQVKFHQGSAFSNQSFSNQSSSHQNSSGGGSQQRTFSSRSVSVRVEQVESISLENGELPEVLNTGQYGGLSVIA